MKSRNTLFFVLVLFALVLAPAAYAELPDPGMTQDSPLHFLDRFFDSFKNPADVADERAAEVLALAQENKIDALEKALGHYESAMEKRGSSVESEDDAQSVAEQAAEHSREFNVSEVPEEARLHLVEARGVAVAQLTELLDQVPEAARGGLQRALDAVRGVNLSNLPDDPRLPDVQGRPDSVPGDQVANDSVPDDDLQDSEEKPAKGADNIPENAGGEGELDLLVKDAPADISDFDQLVVHVSEARVFQENSFNGSNDTKDWFMADVNESFDLTMLVNGSVFSLVEMVLDAGEYSKVELYVESINGSVDNESASVNVPSNKLMLVKPFTIYANETTTFVFDIHVARTGKGLDYNLRPVIAKSGTVGEDIEEDDIEEVECTLDEDCSEALICIEGACVEDPAECHVDEDCDEGLVCLAEMCVVAPDGNESNATNESNETVDVNESNQSNST